MTSIPFASAPSDAKLDPAALGLPPLVLDEVRKALYKKSFYAFARDFWSVVEPAVVFRDARHMKALCDHFQAVYEGRILKLNIEIGPGYAKSMVVSVLGPAWIWGPAGDPGFRIISSTQEHPLTIRDSLRFRALVYSPEYQKLWGDTVRPMSDNNKQDYIENTARGFRVSKSVGGKATGHRAHMVITDDTLDASETGDAALETVEKHLKALSTRRVNPRTFRWINVGQRLHEMDAGGWCRRMGFETLCLPTEYDPSRHCTTSIGFSDWRTERGELLDPVLYGTADIAEAKEILGPDGYSAQHQQLPVPAEGGKLKREYIQLFKPNARPKAAFYFLSIDTAQGTKANNDTTAITVWGVFKEGIFLADGWTGRAEPAEVLEMLVGSRTKGLKGFGERYRPAMTVIEAKDWGKAMISLLQANRRWLWPVEPYVPLVDKDTRASQAQPFFFRRRIWMEEGHPLAEAAMSQLAVFPRSKVRDLADAIVQAAIYADLTYTFETLGTTLEYEGAKRASQSKGSIYDLPSNDDDDW